MPTSNIEWLNQNSGRAYPLKEDTTLTDVTGSVTLPSRVLVDFVLVAPADLDLSLNLSSVQLTGSLLSLVFSDADGVIVTSVVIDRSNHKENQGYNLSGQNAYDDAVGRVAIGDLSDIEYDMPEGQYDFAAELETCAIRPDIRGVRALRVVNADGTQSDPIYGTVLLRAGINMRLTYIPGDDPTVRLDALTNDLEEECDCNSELLSPDPITTINGVTPDGNGNLVISTPGPCTGLSGSQGVLSLEDDCAEPCCGCDELEQLTDTLKILQANSERLQAYVDELTLRQEEFSTNVLRTIV